MIKNKRNKRTLKDIGKNSFNFDYIKERDIYSYLWCNNLVRRWKKPEKEFRFESYKEWKAYVVSKYDKYNRDSLVEFRKLLSQSKKNNESNRTYLGYCLPAVLALVLSKSIDMLMNVDIRAMELVNWSDIISWLAAYLVVVIMVMIPVAFFLFIIIFPIVKYDLEDNMYDDYMKILDEIIEKDNGKMVQN